MRKSSVLIRGSIILSFLIVMTGSLLLSHDFYFISNVEANADKSKLQQVESLQNVIKTTAFTHLSKHDKREIECLAKNIYHEAASEPFNGWMGVASVTMNRLLSGNYADSVCGVVYQKNKGSYQFSWVGNKNRLTKINENVYNNILKVATTMYVSYDSSKDVTKGATYYHADYVNPRWKQLERTKKIGRHIFYKSKKMSYRRL